jgi:RNA polymerase sigma-70 factor, ECF subfamily
MSQALEQLFLEVHREHASVIAKAARAFTQNAADCDDLSQEILFSLWRALPDFQGRAKVSTYVYRVAHSCALNWKRSRQRYTRKLDRFELDPSATTASSPADNERMAWLYSRIHELPAVDRSVTLLFLDRLSYAEIAEVTGLSESNVGVRLHRIKQHLTAQSSTLQHEL